MKTCQRCGAALELGARACGSCNQPASTIGSGPLFARGGTRVADDATRIAPARGPGGQRPVPSTIGAYAVRRKLGEGGMGVVYEVEDVAGQHYALKRIRPTRIVDAKLRFLREGRVLSQIRHPGVVRIKEFAHDEDGPYIVTELVEGEGLDQRLCIRLLRPREAARLVQALSEAVAAVHEHGVLHRDIKPSNVILRRPGDTPILIDFGVAHFDDGEGLTRTGTMIGTPAYAPPEQLAGNKGEFSPRSDVFGLGGILYTTLTGLAPNAGDTLSAVLRDAQTVESRWPTKRLLPLELEQIGRRALARDPNQRYAGAAQLAEALAEWLAVTPNADDSWDA